MHRSFPQVWILLSPRLQKLHWSMIKDGPYTAVIPMDEADQNTVQRSEFR